MTRTRTALLAAALLAAFATLTARANAPETAARTAPELHCRLFPRALDAAVQLDTHDAATETGRWVLEAADDGWSVRDVQLVIATKPTGYPQAWAHVCLERPWQP